MLKRAADATFDDRSRGQVGGDALVERVTGRPADVPQPVALNLVMSDRTLFGRDGSPAVLEEYGPSRQGSRGGWWMEPWATNGHARRCGGSTLTRRVGRWWRWNRGRAVCRGGWRRLSGYATRRVGRHTVMRRSAIAITRSRAAGWADQRQERPRHVRGAPTTKRNHRAGRSPRADENGVHTAEFVTPTGAHYRSTAPPLPGATMTVVSEIEVRIGIAIADLHAA